MDDIDDLFVARLMSTELTTASPDTLVEDAADRMLTNEVGSVLIVDDDGGLGGILTRTDFVAIVAGQEPKDRTPVSAYMSTDPLTATAGDLVQDVADRMVEAGIHHMPIVSDDEGVIGMLTTSDLTAYLSTAEAPTP